LITRCWLISLCLFKNLIIISFFWLIFYFTNVQNFSFSFQQFFFSFYQLNKLSLYLPQIFNHYLLFPRFHFIIFSCIIVFLFIFPIYQGPIKEFIVTKSVFLLLLFLILRVWFKLLPKKVYSNPVLGPFQSLKAFNESLL